MGFYRIIRLKPEDYYKCDNIWNMEKNPDMARKWYDELINGSRITFVYIENGEFIGEGSLVLKNNDPDYTILGKRIYLSRMIVKDGYRNRGIGGIIIDYLIDYAKRFGYEEISIGVDTDNLIARHLYEKKGFTNVLFEGEDEYGEYVKLLKKL
ncbi:MAG TPA: GNAT family N-acetyltransferase [Clostridiaceae bacterium]|nr:GNAT family N-acetyltransferase [Clostridiaceae bacterium]